jgi:acyl-CoA synthetase (AMP-forming)/AMP-acid ligase II
MIAALDVTASEAFFLPTPLASITGLVQMQAAMSLHATLILEERFSPQKSLQRLIDCRATVVGGAPIIMQSLLDEATRRGRTDIGLRFIALGGSMIPPQLLSQARKFGITPIRVYGSSEAPFSSSTNTLDTETLDEGTPLGGVEMAIDTERQHELLVRGPHSFHGYARAADNAEAFRGNWIRTGDQAAINDGRVTITGRIKEVVIRKGMKISLAEIDAAATQLGECVAFGTSDDDTGERLVLAVCPKAAAPVLFEDVIAHLRAAGLTPWKLPEQIVVWDSPLPRTASGKISRTRVAELSAELPALFADRLSDASHGPRRTLN